MAQPTTDKHGSRSDTPRANAVRDYYADEGVDTSKLIVVDNVRPTETRYAFEGHPAMRHVTVTEAEDPDGDDMDGKQFAAYMRACNGLVNDSPANRFIDDAETRCAIDHDYVDTELMSQTPNNPKEAGEQLADPNAAQEEGISVYHHGGNRFTVIDETSGVESLGYRVDMDTPLDTGEPVKSIFKGQDSPSADQAKRAVAAVVRAGPEYRPGPQEQLNVTVGGPSGTGGNDAATSSSDDTPENDTGESWDSSVTPENASDDIATIEAWFERYGSFKSDFDPEAMEITSGAWEGTPGYKLESNPFEAGYYKKNDWVDKEGFDAHKEAMRELMQSDDADAIEWYGEPDYINFMPADAVDTVAE